MSAFYFLNREKENRKPTIFNILLFNFIVGGLACLGLYFYPELVGNIYRSEEMTHLAPKMGVVIWLWIFSAFLEVVAIANQEARLAMIFIIFAQFTKTVLMAGAVMIFTTVEAFMYAAMVQAALQTFILLFYLNNRFPRFWKSIDWSFFRQQAYYALPFGFAGILWTLQTDIHTYFVGNRFSEAEYAIYSVGIFQLPLLAMLMESTAAVLISRMSELQSRNDKREIINLTIRAMQKLSFFYFPAYAFMLITSYTFITTLYTEKFAPSVAIFVINLTLLPFDIWITDPIIRAYQEFGRFLMVLRIFILIGLVGALWFGIQNFDLRGMIAIVVITSLIERTISTSVLIKKLGVKWTDINLMKGIAKTALIAAIAAVTLEQERARRAAEDGRNLRAASCARLRERLYDPDERGELQVAEVARRTEGLRHREEQLREAEARLRELTEALAGAEAVVEGARERLRAADADLEVVEKHREEWLADQRQERTRREERLSDEVVQARHAALRAGPEAFEPSREEA